MMNIYEVVITIATSQDDKVIVLVHSIINIVIRHLPRIFNYSNWLHKLIELSHRSLTLLSQSICLSVCLSTNLWSFLACLLSLQKKIVILKKKMISSYFIHRPLVTWLGLQCKDNINLTSLLFPPYYAKCIDILGLSIFFPICHYSSSCLPDGAVWHAFCIETYSHWIHVKPISTY